MPDKAQPEAAPDQAPAPSAAERASPMPAKLEQLRQRSAEYLDVVASNRPLDPEEKNHILQHTLENFDDYFNRGFLHYRKSVAEAEDFAAI